MMWNDLNVRRLTGVFGPAIVSLVTVLKHRRESHERQITWPVDDF
jgi:hypothetical protein